MSEHELNIMIAQFQEKIKDLKFELKDLREQMARKNAYIVDLDAEIYWLKKELPPDPGAQK